MNAILRDLYGHQALADAEHWRPLGAHRPARDDQAIRNRLHHIHFVQRLFLWMVGDRTIQFSSTKPEDFASFLELEAYARAYHVEVSRFMETVTDSRLLESLTIPWAPKDSAGTTTVTEALTQGAMHSHYHRGQNATRLRELGGEPPSTDLIVWYWKGRPAPGW